MRLRDRRVQQTFPVHLTCQAVGSPGPSITWARNGVPVKEDDRHALVRSDDGFHSLELSSALLEDGGEYSATASNALGSVTCRCTLVVDKGIRAYLAPEFVAEVGPGEEVEVREGEDLYLFAIVEAYPSVGVDWHRDSARLRQSQHTTATLDRDGRVELCVRRVTARDAGLYTCTASNEVGRASSAARVRVVPAGNAVAATLQLRDEDTPPAADLPYSKEPAFIRKPRSFDVEEGDDVVIVCEVVGDPKPEVCWLRDWLKPDYYHHSPQFVRVGSGPEYRLEIPQVRLDFTGTYAILARNQHGETKAVISLQVYAKGQGMGDDSKRKTVKRGKEETLPSVVQPLQDLRCCDGDSVTLECRVDAKPAPDVHWKKDGKLVRLSDNYQAELLGDGRARLRIQRVVPEDEGQYCCVAFNSLGRATSAACLVVDVPEEKENLVSGQLDRPHNLRSAGSTPRSSPRSTPRSTPSRSASPYIPRGGLREVAPQVPSLDRPRRARPSAPRFYAVPHNRVAELGETVRFQCAAAGHPSPWARWDKDGVSCCATARVSVTERDDVRVLEVRQVTAEDAGLYRVVLENEFGRVEASARLEVIGRRGVRPEPLRASSSSPARTAPAPAFARRPASQVARVGGEVTLACDLDGSSSPVTNWYKDGDLVVRGPRTTPSWDGRVCRLAVRALRPSDAGVYTCVASNAAGETRCSARLLVLDKGDPSDADRRPPVFVRGLARHTDAAEGKPLELQVELRGSAPFQVVWLKNGVELPDCGDFRQLSLGDGRFALRMQDMFPEDTATYSCEAFNGHGEARTQGTIAVVDGAPRGAPCAASATWIKTPLGVMATPGSPASFCARLSDPLGRPRKVTWSVAGRSVVPDNIKYQVVEDGDELLLHVRRVAAEDAGAVQCRVHACGAQDDADHRAPCGAACFDLSCTADLIVLGDEPRDARAASLDRDRSVANGCSERPAVLLRGPADTTALRGERVQLTALYAGEPEPTVRWLRAGRELSADDRTTIRTAAGVSCLALQPVCADDAGKYVVSVENIYGADHHYASVAVEGPPDPPAGRPAAMSDPAGELCAVLTWSSPPYDGGRCVDGYVVEGRTESEAEWRVVAERCHSLSAVVRDLAPGRRHVFRVRAENVHGQSEPSAPSLPYCTPALTECGDEPPPPPFAPRVVSAEPQEGFLARFELLEELGRGRYGTVHRVAERATGHALAAKLIRTIKAKDRQQVYDEIAIMNLLRHPKLLQLAAAFEGPREMIMVMEYISGGELFERVVADDFTLTERDCILFMRQICEGVDYMHQNQVVHLDLKPENIMCQTRTSHQIKLIDFGLAQKLKPDTPVRVLFGTPEFIPPEIISYEPIGTESDMWSVGVICYVLLSGLSPFMGDNDAETFANITRADFDFDDEAFDAISQDARDFISGLLVKRKEKRLTARQCLEHSWLAQQPASMSCIALSTDKLKKFIIRRKWQKTGNAIRALGRMATLSAASRRNSAASAASASGSASAPGSPSLPRAALALGLSKEDSFEEAPPARMARTAGEGNAAVAAVEPEVLDATHDVAADVAVEGEPEDAVEEAVTATLVPRGRFCSERSDSGISDCSSASSRNRGDHQALPAPAALFGKKFSISEEVDEATHALSVTKSPETIPATRPEDLPPPLPLSLSPAPTPAPLANGSPSQPSVTNASAAVDGTSVVSRRADETRSASNLGVHSSPAPAAAAAVAAAAADTAVGRGAAAAAAGLPPHKTAGVGGLGLRAGRATNGTAGVTGGAGLRSPTKTRPPVGFVESKIKSLENQSSRVTVTVEGPRERVSLRDTWRRPDNGPVRTAAASTAASRSPSRPAASPSRLAASDRRDLSLGLSPSRHRVASPSPGRSPGRRAGSGAATSPAASPGGLGPSPLRGARPTIASSPTTRKAPLDTGLVRRTPATPPPAATAPHDAPPKSPTLRRMLAPNKLGAHSAGFQKTLEFWKR